MVRATMKTTMPSRLAQVAVARTLQVKVTIHPWFAGVLAGLQLTRSTFEVATAFSPGPGPVGSSGAYHHGSAHTCPSGSSIPSVGSEQSIATAGPVVLSHLQSAAENTTQPTSIQADATTTIHVTMTTHITKTVQATGKLPSCSSLESWKPNR